METSMNVAFKLPEQAQPFKSNMLPYIRPQRGVGKGSQYSKSEQKRIIEHMLVHKLRADAVAKHFNVSMPTVYNWKRDYLIGMYADEVIYNQTIAFRRS